MIAPLGAVLLAGPSRVPAYVHGVDCNSAGPVNEDHAPCHPSSASATFLSARRLLRVDPVLAAITSATASHCGGGGASCREISPAQAGGARPPPLTGAKGPCRNALR